MSVKVYSQRKHLVLNWEDSQATNRVKDKTKYLLKSLNKEMIYILPQII